MHVTCFMLHFGKLAVPLVKGHAYLAFRGITGKCIQQDRDLSS